MIDPNDLKIDLLYPSRGGQYVGYTAIPIRVTHLPTNTVVELTARSQHKARAIAIEMIEWALASKLF